MAHHLSEPIENLIELVEAEQIKARQRQAQEKRKEDARRRRAGSRAIETTASETPTDAAPDTASAAPCVDVLIVGSGYGGTFAAMRLAGEGRTVYVLERGEEHLPGAFPKDLGDAPGAVQYRRPTDEEGIGYANGLFDFRFGDDVDVLVGSGLGGTSLINANVAAEPDDEVFQHASWPQAIRNDLPRIKASYGEIRRLLGVPDAHSESGETRLSQLGLTHKYAALQRLATAVGGNCTVAPIAVTLSKRTPASGAAPSYVNEVGVAQQPCTMCGNCVTGCNVGAKNTLAMNLIPLAKARGACFYTGASVLTVEENKADFRGRTWRVRFRRTVTAKTPLADEIYDIDAKLVILAAGTLGSTEILLRSKQQRKLDLSGVGERFSTNGDGIASSFAEAQPVNALGRADALVTSDVGPTICGMIRLTTQDPETGKPVRLTIEDGAIPFALNRIFGEAMTTAALFNRLANGRLPAWFRNQESEGRAQDPLAVNGEALAHSQVLLVMGDDGAGGAIELEGAPGKLDRATAKVVWKNAARNPALRCADAVLAAHDRKPGFSGGQYIANPLWRLLPEQASTVMSGAAPGGRVLTVHPLGGCPMGDDVTRGVVDDLGRVYCTHVSRTHYDGLYVLDGSIIPTALAVNPFLTICALASRSCDSILEAHGWTESMIARTGANPPTPRLPAPSKIEHVPLAIGFARAAHKSESPAVAFNLSEQLIGRLDCTPDPQVVPVPGIERWSTYQGLVVRVLMQVPDMEAWLSNPGAQPLHAKLALYINPLCASYMRRVEPFHVPSKDMEGATPVATLDGTVALLTLDRARGLKAVWRALKALNAYFKRRQSLLSVILERLFSKKKRTRLVPQKPVSVWQQIKGFWEVALMQADYRTMTYEFQGMSTAGDFAIALRGQKRLAWALDNPRIWDALVTLPVEMGFARDGKRQRATGKITVDTQYLAGAGMPQVMSSPHLPASVAMIGGLGGFFARALIQTNFWEFGAPAYPDEKLVPNPHPRALRVNGRVIQPEEVLPHPTVRYSARSPKPIPIGLTRYRQPAGAAEPVLLIHGLAQGSLIYCTETVDQNMASALWEKGYEVWLLDLRLSNRFPENLDFSDKNEKRRWTLDDIACYDIPTAVDYVFEQSGNRPLRVFAHCVGATVVAMAVLKGWVHANRFAGVAFNAIHPWIRTSPVNRFRASLGTFFRDAIGDDLLDPLPQVEPKAMQVVFDRLAFSLARYGEAASEDDATKNECHPLVGSGTTYQAVCDRMSFLYGRMWRHTNLDHRTHEAFKDLMGPAPGEVYRQLYYFSNGGRITDREGQNQFLRERFMRKRWDFPTMFFHGEHSEVFNPQSATISAVRMTRVMAKDRPFEEAQKQFSLARIPDYGHMDVIFAKDASERVYERLLEFFAQGLRPSPSQAWSDPYRREDDRDGTIPDTPSAGPVLRAAWVKDGAIHLRLWTELLEATTSEIVGVRIAGNVAVEWRINDCEQRYRLVDVCLREVPPSSVKPLPRFPWGSSRTLFRELDWPKWIGLISKADQPAPCVAASESGTPDVLSGVTPWAVSPSAHVAGGVEPALPDVSDPAWLQRLQQRSLHEEVNEMSFLVGSCRYPGTPFERDCADAVFAGMWRHVAGPRGGESAQAGHSGVDLLFLIGDQIYADATANIFDNQAWREKFSLQYRTAFTGEALSQVLRSVPTHFAVDDHEFDDNWSGLPPQNGPLPRLPKAEKDHRYARRAACSFQSSGREKRNLPGAWGSASALWYPLSHQAESVCPAFVMDTRSERELRMRGDAGLNACLTGRTQWAALMSWLLKAQKERPDHPKFVISGTPIAPVCRSFVEQPSLWRREDGWAGYPDSLGGLVQFIVKQQIRNVVFVGGDLHLSAFGCLTFTLDGYDPVTAWQVVSSGLYAPMPFANSRISAYAWNERYTVPLATGSARIEAEVGLLYAGESHFVRVDTKRVGSAWELEVSAFDASGNAVEPSQRPPQGAVQSDRRWSVRFTARPSEEPSQEETEPARV